MLLLHSALGRSINAMLTDVVHSFGFGGRAVVLPSPHWGRKLMFDIEYIWLALIALCISLALTIAAIALV